jgi:hypothetical protein
MRRRVRLLDVLRRGHLQKGAFPGELSTTVTLPSDITMTAFTVSFDTRGVPYSDAEAETGTN